MRAQSPTPPASARTPAERLREVWSEEQGWPWCWCRALGVAAAALSALPRAIGASSAALPRSGRRETQEECSRQQSVTPAAAAPVRGSGSSSPVLPSSPQQVESMATALDTRCPICLDSWVNPSYVVPCLHRFCFECIQRWAESKPECPLCKRRVSSIVHSVRADNRFKELVIPPPAEAPVTTQQADGTPAHPASRPEAAGPVPTAAVGGLHPFAWASLFRLYPAVLQPLLPWLRHELGQLLGDDGRAASEAQRNVISGLRFFGLDEGALTLLLRTSLGRQTAGFVQRLIATAVQRCSGEAQNILGLGASRAAGGQGGSPAAVPSHTATSVGTPSAGPESSEGTNAEELPGTSNAAFHGRPSRLPSVPVPEPRNQQVPAEEPEEAVAGPSTAGQGRDQRRRGPRRAAKRRAPTCQDSAPPAKRPPRRRH
ncbi:E3 ubiquitin-protein ligase Topors-like [Anser cygnoides]|uniref:E3 ubiquitin-protein ligase Topors-like n=1 Tax=Anser cygnoides TaxID=8845 RepID=UPI0034D2C6F3